VVGGSAARAIGWSSACAEKPEINNNAKENADNRRALSFIEREFRQLTVLSYACRPGNHLLHSVTRTMHSPALPFWQSFREASSAASAANRRRRERIRRRRRGLDKTAGGGRRRCRARFDETRRGRLGRSRRRRSRTSRRGRSRRLRRLAPDEAFRSGLRGRLSSRRRERSEPGFDNL
jgi:hypothetical protein